MNESRSDYYRLHSFTPRFMCTFSRVIVFFRRGSSDAQKRECHLLGDLFVRVGDKTRLSFLSSDVNQPAIFSPTSGAELNLVFNVKTSTPTRFNNHRPTGIVYRPS